MTEAEAPTKPVLTSKTILANLAAMAAPYMIKFLGIDIPVNEVAVVLLALVNIGLRFATKKGISLT